MNLLKTLGGASWQILKTVAPTIAATAAGPFAPLVLPVLQKVFGTTDASQLDAAITNATPTQLAALKQEEDRHSETIAQLGIQRDQLAYEDTANARQMQTAVRSWVPSTLALLSVGGFYLLCGGMIAAMIFAAAKWAAIPAAAMALLGTIVGNLQKDASLASTFYFGSSADSQAKTVTLSEIAKS